jgi:hypothetical protein
MVNVMSLKPGRYYIGDLCYVMHDKWDEFCDLTCSGDDVLTGEMKIGDVAFASYGTAYGDGEYRDNKGRSYCVDAGLIGCILVDDIHPDEAKNLNLGHVVEFTNRVESGFLRKEEGTIYFTDGMTDVYIRTDEDYEEEVE